MLSANAISLMQGDAGRAEVFYAQSWGWLRFLRQAAGDEAAGELAIWEARCRGGALGAPVGHRGDRSSAPAARQFEQVFGAQLAELEVAFAAWLDEL